MVDSLPMKNIVTKHVTILTLSTKMADSKIKTLALTILSFFSMQPLEKPKSDYKQ